MKALVLLVLLVGCKGFRSGDDVTWNANSRSLGCQVHTIEGRKFVVCDTHRGVTMAPLDACR